MTSKCVSPGDAAGTFPYARKTDVLRRRCHFRHVKAPRRPKPQPLVALLRARVLYAREESASLPALPRHPPHKRRARRARIALCAARPGASRPLVSETPLFLSRSCRPSRLCRPPSSMTCRNGAAPLRPREFLFRHGRVLRYHAAHVPHQARKRHRVPFPHRPRQSPHAPAAAGSPSISMNTIRGSRFSRYPRASSSSHAGLAYSSIAFVYSMCG